VRDFKEILKMSIISTLNDVRQDLNMSSSAARMCIANDIYKSVMTEYNKQFKVEDNSLGNELILEDE
jgi:hypothetical protein